MSETIDITSLHGGDSIGLTDYSALGLVDFDFFPHLNHDRENFLSDIIVYSKVHDSVIYACNDGDGIIVNGDDLEFFGEVLRIENGIVSVVR